MGRWVGTSWLYGVLVLAVAAIHYLAPIRRGGRSDGGWTWFRRRIAVPQASPPESRAVVWLHGVSAGEAKVAARIAAILKRADASLSCVVSTSTETGLAVLKDAPEVDRVEIMPPDMPYLVARLAKALCPDVAVLCESDFWPGYFDVLRRRHVPVVIANARMSQRSCRRFRALPWLARSTFASASAISAQDDEMSVRFAACLPAGARVPVSGNLKLAMPTRRAQPAAQRDAITFASIHDKELPLLAGPLRALAQALPKLCIFVVPRFPGDAFERQFAALMQGHYRQSDGDGRPSAPGISLVNRMGSLPRLYARSVAAVVGGSFAPIGGHDVAEPLHHGAVAFTGPHAFRQKSLVEALTRAGVLEIVTPVSLVEAIVAQIADDGRRAAQLETFALLSQEAEEGLAMTVAIIRQCIAARDITGVRDSPLFSGGLRGAE
jgi:3-deoxy-D-manno-octulosonic-acid transferase